MALAQKVKPPSDAKRCCTKPPKYLITYDCGTAGYDTYLVCQDHFEKDECFNRFVVGQPVGVSQDG